jgi:DNA mismatch repair protein MutS2
MSFMIKTLEFDQILTKVSGYAKTERIKREILELLPSTDLLSIERSLQECVDLASMHIRLGHIPLIDDFDIHQLLQYAKIERDFNMKELLMIRLFLSMEKDVLSYFREAKRLEIPLRSINPYFERMHDHKSILDYLRKKMDEDGLIYDDASPELLKIRKEMHRYEKSLQDKLQKLLGDLSAYLNENVIVMRNDRFCLPIKDAYKNKIKGVIHDLSATKQTVYIEPDQTRAITAKLESLKIAEENEIRAIMKAMTRLIQEANQSIIENLDLFLACDFISAKTCYAESISANKPRLNDKQRIHLIKARHPLIDPHEVVPIDVEIDEYKRTLLITGPNTGGKTVALKTVGLMVLMVQSGLLVPAHEESELSVFEHVFADIGDEQSIAQSLSTFSSHLTKIVYMLEHVTDRSLVLLDEIGSGTDPNEGFSLAIAILDAFRKKNIRMMVTTHYSELKSYAYEEEYMAVASVAFDKKTLKPLYYLQMGATGSSHAFLIAQRLGLDEAVVDEAKRIHSGRQTDLARVMEKLSDEMGYVEQQKKTYMEELEKTKLAKNAYEQEMRVLNKERDHVIRAVRKKEEEKWQKVIQDAEKLLDDLQRKQHLTKPEFADLKHRIRMTDEHSEETVSQDSLGIGDDVFIIPYQQYGKIIESKNDRYRVVFGKFDLTFQASELKKEQNKPSEREPKKRVSTGGATPARRAPFELDLRGYRYDEVKPALDDAIDQALLSGTHSFRVIHGFGSGAVRNAVHDYIKRSDFIKSHRFGGEGEGLNGVTIITLK